MLANLGQYVPVLVAMVVLLFVLTIYLQYKWGKTVRENVQVIVRKADGHGDYGLAPQQGGSVSLKNPHNNTTRLWPINALATIDLPYPHGAVPDWMKKNIRTVLVDEEDWEPLLNRSPYKEKVASPDVIQYMQNLAERVQTSDEELSNELMQMAEELSPAPTREMIASPAVLGNLINEKITEAVITVNKETIDTLKNLVGRIGNVLTANLYWIGVGILALGLVASIALTVMARNDVSAIKAAMGLAAGGE